jgi:hypothetical protein
MLNSTLKLSSVIFIGELSRTSRLYDSGGFPKAEVVETVATATVVPSTANNSTPIQATVVASDDEFVRMILNRTRASMHKEMVKEIDNAKHDMILCSGDIKTDFRMEIERVKVELKELAFREVKSETNRRVKLLINNNAEVKSIIEEFVSDVETKLDAKCREILDRVVDEQEYGMINEALERSLTKKMEKRIENNMYYALALNGVLICVGGVLSHFLLKK